LIAGSRRLLRAPTEFLVGTAGLDLSAKDAWQLLKTVRVVEIDLGQGQRKRSVTQGSARAAQILKAIGIIDLNPASTATGPQKAA